MPFIAYPPRLTETGQENDTIECSTRIRWPCSAPQHLTKHDVPAQSFPTWVEKIEPMFLQNFLARGPVPPLYFLHATPHRPHRSVPDPPERLRLLVVQGPSD